MACATKKEARQGGGIGKRKKKEEPAQARQGGGIGKRKKKKIKK